MDDVSSQTKLLYPFNRARPVAYRVYEKNGPLLEGLHLGQCAFHRALADLRCDCKEELGALLYFRLHPHITLH
jgi:hypothetical protein